MGYSFTDLGAEGCCRSLNALFNSIFLLYETYILFIFYDLDGLLKGTSYQGNIVINLADVCPEFMYGLGKYM